MQKAHGICLGASTISAVSLSRSPAGGNRVIIEKVMTKAHEGNPKAVFEQIVRELGLDSEPLLVTGRKFRSFVKAPSVTEPEAVEYALDFIGAENGGAYDALVSAGGETFMVYTLDKNQKISGISTGNKCAAGTGEFFLQQIRRMDLGISEAVDLAGRGEPYLVTGRCSVFCKSDCTHALNKGVPVSNVTAGLCRMIAQKIVEITAKVSHNKILLVGGTALNKTVVDQLRQELGEVTVPKEAPYFEALGAALLAFERGKALPPDLFHTGGSSFPFLEPLPGFESLVTFNEIEYQEARTGERCLIGLDVGSTTTKAVLLRAEDHALLGSVYLRTNGNPIEASRSCFQGLLERLAGTEVDIIGIGVTGSGRQIAGLYALTEGIINEIISHAAAAVYFDSEVDTIFEIGGQDAKYTHITSSVASDYAMNEACSAGTGSFLEEAAFETLGVKMEEIADSALQAKRPPNFNDQCAAFISSDIKNATHEGITRNDILAGLVYSICFNYVNRVKGNRPVGKKIFMQGGVCYNRAVPLAMAGILKKQIIVPPEPGLMGAFGVALELKKRIDLGLIKEKKFGLKEIAAREVSYEKSFVCAGGKEKCDLKCKITRVRINSTVYPFGGSCNRYYNIRFKKTVDDEARDYVKVRNGLMFEKYAPPRPAGPGAPVIGLNTSFLTMKLLPLYYNFFSHLGCRIVMPDRMEPDAANHMVTSMCFPAEVAIGLYENLALKKPDYVFIPHATELYVPKGIERLEFCATCAFSQGEGFWLRQAFQNKGSMPEILTPTVNFNGGWERGRKAFVETAGRIGFSEKEAGEAFTAAVKAQYAFEEECRQIGTRLLEEIHSDPNKTAIIMFGRPYNAYAPEANKGIPKKFTSRGCLIIPYDLLPYQDEPLGPDYAEYMHWEAGQRILRTAQIVKRDSRIYGVYITNFLCAPDSFLVSHFRRVMGTKPSLTLELDAHTADAGINTRIEAFLDIIENYRQVQQDVRDPESEGYRPAKISYKHKGTYYIDSKGKRHRLTDPAVKFILPPMGDFGSKALAAVCRRLGIRTEALPTADSEVLRLGRNLTTGKECIPMIIIIGALARYLKYRKPEDRREKLMILVPRGAGYCRLGQYHVYINQFIKDSRLNDVAVLHLDTKEQFAGLGPAFSHNAWKAIVIIDIVDDIECSIRALAVNPQEGLKIFKEECAKIQDCLDGSSRKNLYKQLRETALRFKEIPLRQPYEETARISLTGEFFVKKDPFSSLGLARQLSERGFLVKIDPISEWMYYMNFLIKEGMIQPDYTLFSFLESFITNKTMRYVEKKIKRIFSICGLFDPELIDVPDLIRHAEYVLPKEFPGEPGLIVGLTMRDALSKYCGIVNVGPFGCMQIRFADSLLTPQANMKGKSEALKRIGKDPRVPGFSENDSIPYLFVESDGNPYPQLLVARFESFCLQAARAGEKQGKRVAPTANRGGAGETPHLTPGKPGKKAAPVAVN